MPKIQMAQGLFGNVLYGPPYDSPRRRKYLITTISKILLLFRMFGILSDFPRCMGEASALFPKIAIYLPIHRMSIMFHVKHGNGFRPRGHRLFFVFCPQRIRCCFCACLPSCFCNEYPYPYNGTAVRKEDSWDKRKKRGKKATPFVFLCPLFPLSSGREI